MASFIAQSVKIPPAMQETWVQFLGWEAYGITPPLLVAAMVGSSGCSCVDDNPRYA